MEEPNTPAAGGAAAAAAPAAQQQTTPEAQAQQQAAAPAAQQQEPAKPRVVPIGEDDELPEGADKYELSRAALASRNNRAARKFLRDNFGTDDPAVVKARIEKAEALEKAEEERRRASLTREQQLEEDRQRAEKKAEHWKSKYRSEVETTAMRQSEEIVRASLGKVLKAKFVDESAFRKLGRHLTKTFSQRELVRLEEEGKIGDEIDKWAAQYAEQNPELAIGYEEKLKGAAAPPPAARPLTNGARPGDQPAPPAGPAQEKSFAPGAGMTPQEARAAAREMGLNWD